LTHSGRLTHKVVTRQPWIRRRSGKVRRLQTDILTTEPRRQFPINRQFMAERSVTEKGDAVMCGSNVQEIMKLKDRSHTSRSVRVRETRWSPSGDNQLDVANGLEEFD